MTHATYDSYKESGVPWLEQIPKHWVVAPIKRFADMYNGSTPKSSEPLNWDGDIFWATPEDLGNNKAKSLNDTKRKITKVGYDSANVYLVPSGSIILSTRAPIGHLAIAGKEMCFNQGCKGLVPHQNIDSDFLYYLFKSANRELNARGHGTTFLELGNNQLGSLPVPIPPLTEQKAIAEFLDNKTAQIDALIAKKKNLLKLLAEQRTALITNAVTRGLDGSAPMKDSGITWLGKVPNHWEVKPIKWITSVKRGASPRPIENPAYFDDEGEYAWVRIADVTASDVYLSKTTQRLSDLGSSLSVKMESGQLFLSIAGSVGKPIIANIKCCIHDGFVYFPELIGDSKFLFYIFLSGKPYLGLGKLGTQLNLNTDTIGAIRIGYPPIPEQKAIADFLDCKTAEIDATKDRITTAIDTLKEYRTALITNAVTGKIKVV